MAVHDMPTPDEVADEDLPPIVRCVGCRLLFVSRDRAKNRVCSYCDDGVVDKVPARSHIDISFSE